MQAYTSECILELLIYEAVREDTDMSYKHRQFVTMFGAKGFHILNKLRCIYAN